MRASPIISEDGNMIKRSGQSQLEYSLLLVIFIAALLTMQVYIKRGVQGRWNASVDDLGDQYDPATANGRIRYTARSTSNTFLNIVSANIDGRRGFFTLRTDRTSLQENRIGGSEVGN